MYAKNDNDGSISVVNPEEYFNTLFPKLKFLKWENFPNCTKRNPRM